MDQRTREALIEGIDTIDKIVEEHELPDNTQAEAMKTYRKTVESDTELFSGRGYELIAAACVLLATRQTSTVCSAEDIEPLMSDHITTKRLYRALRDLRDALDIGVVLADPHAHVDDIQEELGATDEFISVVHDAVDVVLAHGVCSGHKAAAVAATTAYTVTRFHPESLQVAYTQKQVAAAGDVSAVTIRNHYRDYAQVLADGAESPVGQ